ncbi:MAG TPA: cytochrome C oxidase subunit IV family protein [Terriglobales bacterium]|nr:cytochrome C oxidase subunit IV family protein [Terriglobales bacterium]
MADHSEHIVSSKLYWLIWLILIICTVLTAWVATIDLGKFNTVVALTIATFKASIVVLIFMHVKYTSERMTKALLISAVFWLILLLVLSLTDYSSRPDTGEQNTVQQSLVTPSY